MNTGVLKGKWMQLRGKVKEWWGELTDDDLDRIAGEWEQLIGHLQGRYGYTRARRSRSEPVLARGQPDLALGARSSCRP
jgi:uncharacterized protein YjbJ (UPF0337 family)